MGEGDTLVNALIGAAVAVLLSFLPLSPLLGGLVAGYLEGGDRDDGVRVGAIAGLVTFLPLAGLAVLLVGVGVFLLAGGLPFHLGVVGVVLLLVFGVVVVGVYTVGLAALGGWLGNYVITDTEFGRS